jgi:hypothetical protein
MARQGVGREEKENGKREINKYYETMKNTKAIMNCAKWLSYCLKIGWNKKDIDELEKLWWKFHDEMGNLI